MKSVTAAFDPNRTLRESLLDHLVGELLKMHRHIEAERFGGFEIDHKLELGWLLNGQIIGLLAPEYPINIRGRPSELIEDIRPVGNKAARRGEIPECIDRWQLVARG
jgi:hypothetical protein